MFSVAPVNIGTDKRGEMFSEEWLATLKNSGAPSLGCLFLLSPPGPYDET